ncbi:MAG: hypothetical protein ACI379_15130, partial [Nocardioides sp.]
SLLDEIVDAFASRDGAAVFGVVDKVIETGQDPRRFTEDLLRRLRDLVIVAAVPDAPASGLIDVPQDAGERLVAQAARFGGVELSRAADIIAAGLTEMRGATAPRLLLELLCARVLLPGADNTSDGVMARLDRLERRMEMPGGLSAPSAPAARPHGVESVRPEAARPEAGRPESTRPAPAQEAPAHPQAGPVQAAPTPPPVEPARSEPPRTEPPRREAPQIQPPRPADPDGPVPPPSFGDPGAAAPPSWDDAPVRPPSFDDPTPPPDFGAPVPPVASADPVPPAPVPAAPQQSAPAGAYDQGPAQQSPGQQAQPAADATPAPTLSLVDVRRLWPDVLDAVKSRRRLAWMILTQNAQVVDADSRTLTLGFSNAGARDSFVGGGCDEILRDAAIDVVGVQWKIDTLVDPSARPSGEPVVTRAAQSHQPSQAYDAPPTDQWSPPAPDQSSGPAPDWSQQPESGQAAPAEPAAPPAPPSSSSESGGIAVAREALSQIQAGGATQEAEEVRSADDDAHPDDTVLDSGGLDSTALLEQTLGAQVIDEIEHT